MNRPIGPTSASSVPLPGMVWNRKLPIPIAMKFSTKKACQSERSWGGRRAIRTIPASCGDDESAVRHRIQRLGPEGRARPLAIIEDAGSLKRHAIRPVCSPIGRHHSRVPPMERLFSAGESRFSWPAAPGTLGESRGRLMVSLKVVMPAAPDCSGTLPSSRAACRGRPEARFALAPGLLRFARNDGKRSNLRRLVSEGDWP